MPAEHLARLIAVLVDEHLELAPIRAADGRDTAPCDPCLLVGILLYGYITGVRSSRLIERRCVDDACFRWLAAGQVPDHREIARFRRRHLAALTPLFVQALVVCQAAGVLRLGRIALDGTTNTEKVLTLLADAERIDTVEDATWSAAEIGEGPQQSARRPTGSRTITTTSTVQRALVGALLLALTFAGGHAVAVHKRVTLSVDDVSMTVSTMKSRVIDVVRENGFAVGEHDELHPGADQRVHQSDTIVLRRARPLQVSIDGQPSTQEWTTALTVDEALKQLSMGDAAPAAASRASRSGAHRGPSAGIGGRAAPAGRRGGAPGVYSRQRGHADRGDPHQDP
jgi:transposase